MLKTSSVPAPKSGPIPIDARAADHLRYIRETMESAAEFTAVPGWGGVAMGITALVAALVASQQSTPRAWFGVWLVEAFDRGRDRRAGGGYQGASRQFQTFLRPGPEISFQLCASDHGGRLVDVCALRRGGLSGLLPGAWLLLYGAAIVTGGAFSVRVVPVMGLLPDGAGRSGIIRAGGLGRHCLWRRDSECVQIAFGIWIARRYGG